MNILHSLNCHNTLRKSTLYGQNLTFHKFPSELPIVRKWLSLISIKSGKKPSKYSRICSCHFQVETDFIVCKTGKKKRRTLKKSALPSQNLPEVKNGKPKQPDVKRILVREQNSDGYAQSPFLKPEVVPSKCIPKTLPPTKSPTELEEYRDIPESRILHLDSATCEMQRTSKRLASRNGSNDLENSSEPVHLKEYPRPKMNSRLKRIMGQLPEAIPEPRWKTESPRFTYARKPSQNVSVDSTMVDMCVAQNALLLNPEDNSELLLIPDNVSSPSHNDIGTVKIKEEILDCDDSDGAAGINEEDDSCRTVSLDTRTSDAIVSTKEETLDDLGTVVSIKEEICEVVLNCSPAASVKSPNESDEEDRDDERESELTRTRKRLRSRPSPTTKSNAYHKSRKKAKEALHSEDEGNSDSIDEQDRPSTSRGITHAPIKNHRRLRRRKQNAKQSNDLKGNSEECLLPDNTSSPSTSISDIGIDEIKNEVVDFDTSLGGGKRMQFHKKVSAPSQWCSSLFSEGEIVSRMEDSESSSDGESYDIVRESDEDFIVHSKSSETDDSYSENEEVPSRRWCEIDGDGGVPRRHEFIGEDTGPHTILTSENSPGEYFKLFFTEELVQQITEETNRYAKQRLGIKELLPHFTWRNWIDVSEEEMHAFIGVVVNMGMMYLPSMADYWSQEWTAHMPFFADVFTFERFLQIFWMLNLSPDEKRPTSKSKKIPDFLAYIDYKFIEHYIPYRVVTIDESTIGSEGKISFKTNHPTKRGLRVYSLTDSRTGYLCTFAPYYGKESTDAFDLEQAELPFSARIVLHLFSKLCENVQDARGYHVYTDRFYTSVKLAKELSKLKCHITGPIVLNRKDNPVMANHDEKLALHEVIAYRCGDIMLLGWKDKRIVWMCSNWHDAKSVEVRHRNHRDGEDETITKPRVIQDYTEKMGRVDTDNRYGGTYCFLSGKTLKWKKLFFWGLDASIVNAFHLYRLQMSKERKTPLTYAKFRRELVYELVGNVRVVGVPKKREQQSNLCNEERLRGQHFLYKNEIRRPKDCNVCSDRKLQGRRHQTVFYCKTCPGKPGLHPGRCFERYHTLKKYKILRNV